MAATTATTGTSAAASEATASTSTSTTSTSPSAATTAAAVVLVDSANDFYNTGRVGRRNALADILCQRHLLGAGAGGLAEQLGGMSTTGRDASDDDGAAGCSKDGMEQATTTTTTPQTTDTSGDAEQSAKSQSS